MSYALLIDDEVPWLQSIQRTARLSGLQLDIASSWEEGIALFQVLSPELVVADYNLPGSSHGLLLLAEIKRLRPSVRVVLVSAYITSEDVPRIEALGLIDRAMVKGDSIATSEAIIEEIRDAQIRHAEPTDWVSFSAASLAARQVEQSKLDALESLLSLRRP